jgi:probable rRNA maturation factor
MAARKTAPKTAPAAPRPRATAAQVPPSPRLPGPGPAKPARGSLPEITVGVSYGVPEDGLPAPEQFRTWVAAAVGRERAQAEVSVRIVDTAEGQELNRRYRHRDYATNVLSFPADLPPELGLPLLGDLVLCAPVIAREAEAQGKAVEQHWAHLTVHGTLHLLGHDHETPAEAREMESLEIQVLERLGIPDPYEER